jgi:hypothetical protein
VDFEAIRTLVGASVTWTQRQRVQAAPDDDLGLISVTVGHRRRSGADPGRLCGLGAD